MGTPKHLILSGALLRGTNRERGHLFRSTQRGVALLCKTEDVAVWLCASSSFSRPPVLPITQFLSVDSADHTVWGCSCSWNLLSCYRLEKLEICSPALFLLGKQDIVINSNFLFQACGYPHTNNRADLIHNHIKNPTRSKKLEQKEHTSQRHMEV